MNLTEGRVWPALLTPLDSAGRPNLTATERLVDVLCGQGLGGLFALGSTGQGVALGLDDRRRVAEVVVRAAAGRMPVMIHVGAVATDDSIALARHAAEIGADAVTTVPPIYYPTSVEATFEHYRRIGAATSLPFFPYHAGFLAQSLPPPRIYAQRLMELPNIRGIKFTDMNMNVLGLLHQYTGGRLALFSGADEVLCHAALSGALGAIGTFYNLWGPAAQRARAAFVAGDFRRGREFMLTFQEAIDAILASGSIWTFLRAAMQLKFDLDIGPPRAPLGVTDRAWETSDVERLVARVEAAAG
ncbi:MAG: dihydrodipicolinate synthase family protein [Pirellulales bacterium]|nr:dihydrodipicolinate synthase family protein [Pirellulales bacterium]